MTIPLHAMDFYSQGDSELVSLALDYRRRGWQPIPVPFRSKNPGRREWQNERRDENDVREDFKDKPMNVGILLGNPSNGLIDIDLDHPKAVELASQYLPPTPARFGRPGKPCSHWIYRVDGQVGTRKFKKDGEMIVEIRSTGAQTVFPPSTHESGELICWEPGADVPTVIEPNTLIAAVEHLAEAVKKSIGEARNNHATSKNVIEETATMLVKGGGDGNVEHALATMIGMNVVDGKDGSARLFACCCRAVEHDLNDSKAIEAIRRYESSKPFPRSWSDKQITARLRQAERKVVRGAAVAKREKGSGAPSQATLLVDLAVGESELWHTPDGDGFVTVGVANHCENWGIRSKGFRRWLSRKFYTRHRAIPSSQALQDALNVVEGQAVFDGTEFPTHVRVAEHHGAIYLDLADRDWQTIQIDKAGWSIVQNPPVKFRRPRAMLALPVPVAGGSAEELRQLVNVSDENWSLVAGWLLGVIRPDRPFPVLCLHGEQGSAKSTTARVLRSLIDPNVAPLRSEPREPRDLMIAANNGWVVALDNLSGVPTWLSDCLCRLSTGGGFSTRTLYENDEETIFDAMRPIILTGIEELATRGDLLDRSLLVTLPRIPEDKRLPEAAFWQKFEGAAPRIMGGFLDAAVTAMKNLPSTSLARLPRMADFSLWVTAGESVLGMTPQAFIHSYFKNRAENNDLALESNPVVKPFLEFLADKDTWRGTSGELLTLLSEMVDEKTKKLKTWPQAGGVLTSKLKRLAPNLREAGVQVDFERTKSGRFLVLTRITPDCGVTHVIDVTRPEKPDIHAGENDTGCDTSDAGGMRRDPGNEVENTVVEGDCDAGDASDGVFAVSSNEKNMAGTEKNLDDWGTI